MKTVEVEYIDDGTFVGGEEDTYDAGINAGDLCFVISLSVLSVIRIHLEKAANILGNMHTGDDFECECWGVAEHINALLEDREPDWDGD